MNEALEKPLRKARRRKKLLLLLMLLLDFLPYSCKKKLVNHLDFCINWS